MHNTPVAGNSSSAPSGLESIVTSQVFMALGCCVQPEENAKAFLSLWEAFWVEVLEALLSLLFSLSFLSWNDGLLWSCHLCL